MEKSVIVEVKNLSKIINGNYIVEKLNFTINRGEIVGFLGENGSGKTTTMKMMLGLTSISQGDVIINGYSIKSNKKKALKSIGAIIETPELYKFLSGYDNLMYFQRMSGRINRESIAKVVRMVGLENVINDKVKTYSLGMRQKLGIAQSLLNSPALLILDEPTNGLDPSGMSELKELLIKLSKKENVAIFISSHLLSELEQICDRVIIIKNGKIIENGTIKEKLSQEEHFISVLVNVEEVDKAEEVIKNIDFISSYKKLNSNDITVNIRHKHIPLLNKILVQNDISVFTLNPIKRSLEEIFLEKFHGQHDLSSTRG
ncbi:ABC transporter ATP-binding protein [Geobacillus icigianus]|uniref:Bacitracin transport ATP-binding protein BcrA n=1 Tax=Geobacillus icigianus TaxID=1430331 RepID=A0ABU6BB96_9BACL|nr:ABC transporter ATP-binding protein [Geobacillus icigianus]MEB3749169.1 Bacitracin transport ATP-binding protein BcrA [Geobacillus icigianus]